MVICRPHKGTLSESLAQAKEFNSFDEMKQFIVSDYERFRGRKMFDVEDIVVLENYKMPDFRTGWADTMYVCLKRYGDVWYSVPHCIGMCATIYPKAGE